MGSILAFNEDEISNINIISLGPGVGVGVGVGVEHVYKDEGVAWEWRG